MKQPLDQKCHREFTQSKEKEGNEICRIIATIMEFEELLLKKEIIIKLRQGWDLHERKRQK